MGFASDLRTLYNLTCKRVRGNSHQERLEAFYQHQADGYDDFRKRLLHGREEMMQALELPAGGRLLDLGGGTGSNIAYLGERRALLERITVVDLCPSLLETARKRIADEGWHNVDTALADVTTFEPEGGLVDVVTFSYSLTMIPDWFRALERAVQLLRVGGTIGVVDFYIGRKWPAAGMRKHSRFQRAFWPTWFGADNVFLSPDHIPWLESHFQTVRLDERLGRVPYLMGLKAPHYIFLGRKQAGKEDAGRDSGKMNFGQLSRGE
jgi:S-adenosylmethionine-diacylgycerolhomoserine-N-methlytransferase